MDARISLPPDWTITGVPMADGTVMVYAAKKVVSGVLDVENHLRQAPDECFYVRMVPDLDEDGKPKVTVTMTTVSRDVTMVRGPDYATALRRLFADWQPERADRSELGPAGEKALTPR